MSSVRCKRKLQFVEVKFDQSGTLIPSKRPRVTATESPKCNFANLGKEQRRESVIESAVSSRNDPSANAQENLSFRQRGYCLIAPRPAQLCAENYQKTDNNPVNGLQSDTSNVAGKETPIKSSYTTSSTPIHCDDWILRVKKVVSPKAPGFQFTLWKAGNGEVCMVSKTDLSGYDLNLLANGCAPVYLHVSSEGNYAIKVLFRDAFKGTLKDEGDVTSLLDIMNSYKICPGLKSPPEVNSALKRTWGFPFQRVDSHKCLLLHLPGNKKQVPGSALFDVCAHCKKLYWKLSNIAKKRRSNGRNRVLKSSTCNWKFLSPKSAKNRLCNLTADARRLTKEVERLRKKLDVSLSPELSSEMRQITSKISSQYRECLDDIFEEAEKKTKGKGGLMKAMWKQDVDERKAFWKDQCRNGKGRTANRWSAITYRIALAVFTRSPAAYEALKSYQILNLPSVSSLKQFTSANTQAAGLNLPHLHDAKQTYAAYKVERKDQGLPEPKDTGVLVFDEVKVVMKVHWNSANNGFVGHAMTADDMSSLQDVYDELRAPKSVKASFIMQFLWRDLTSDFDIIGPYFSSGRGMECKHIISCLMTTMHSFHIYGFKTMAVVCDGASANLKAIKYLTTKESGAYGINENPQVNDPHHVKAWMLNPWTNQKLFFIPCPSHQLKSLIAALHSSRQANGSQRKDFNLYGVKFGWQVIKDLWRREMARAKKGRMRRVPQLCYRHVYRDCWTRLNVKPAKIMQQNAVIAELSEYKENNPPDAENVGKTIEYLDACRQLFERGILSHEKITDEHSSVLQNMSNGYNFFVGWADYAWEQEPNLTASNQKGFLAWQTWDLTRLVYYGFTEFCKHFVSIFPGYYIWPLRLNGSALETIFSQLKFNMNGQLSSVNYSAALTTLKLKRRIHGWRGKFVYRKTPLYVREISLKRK